MTTEQRLERLERENRWMRRIGAVAIAVAAAVFLMGQGGKVVDNLVAKQITLVDAFGRARGVWAVDKSGVSALALSTPDNKLGVLLRTSMDGQSSVSFPIAGKEADDKTWAFFGNWESSSGLILNDSSGRERASLKVDKTGAVFFMCRDRNDARRLLLGTMKDSTALVSVLGPDEKPRIAGGARADGTVEFKVLDSDGNQVMGFPKRDK